MQQDSVSRPPVVILVEPQIGENIGTTARAMLNCGLDTLRLVRPRESWPNPKAVAAASGADRVLEAATLHESVEDALADLTCVHATTARPRDMVKPVLDPRQAAPIWHRQGRSGRVGLLFGRERSGLDNDEVALADAVVEVPLNPSFRSLNLAQAVLLCAYEWRMADIDDRGEVRLGRDAAPATKQELADFYRHLEGELDRAGFLFPPEKRPRMVRNIRNIFARGGLTGQEVRSLRGIIGALARPLPSDAGEN